ncbi:MAG: hypothetical protein JO241_00125 [Candidatus Eremiobacteraeota bacterium]|nr:hypothetical protein [Candidatus Eremiobacteraeota bacterium]
MKVTAFVDVLSHWCLAAQPALKALRSSLADDVALEVRYAPVGTTLTGIPEDALRAGVGSEAVAASLHAANARLAAIGCAERPSWELVNDNGDRAVLQGVWQAEAILPLMRALLDDERAYRRAGAPPFA